MKKFFVTILASAMIVSCAGLPSRTTSPSLNQTQASLLNTSWILSDGISTSSQIPTLLISSSGIAGNAGCNDYFSNSFTSNPSNGSLSISNVGTTRKACPSMQGEQNFLQMIQQADRYTLVGDELELYKGNLLLLKFRKNK